MSGDVQPRKRKDKRRKREKSTYDNDADDDANDADDDDEADDDDDDGAADENAEESAADRANENEDDDDNTREMDQDDDDDDGDDDDIEPIYTRVSEQATKSAASNADNDNNDDIDENDDDDDEGFDSVENVVENDAEEELLLREKAREQTVEKIVNDEPIADEQREESEHGARSWLASLAVNIGVGVALALVARLVLIRKNPAAKFSEEEIEIEEEIEYIEEDEDVDDDDDGRGCDDLDGMKIASGGKYVPETFEQLNSMYRPKASTDVTKAESVTNETQIEEQKESRSGQEMPARRTATFNAPPPPPLVRAPIQHDSAGILESAEQKLTKVVREEASNQKPSALSQLEQKRVPNVTHAVDYEGPDEEGDNSEEASYEHDYAEDDDDDVGNEGDDDDLLEDDDSNISDVDDSDLMNRLEAKYGRLPPTEYESDDDPDDPTWTQIKPKAGPRDDDNDSYEELRRANAQLMSEQLHAALTAFTHLTDKYPDLPEAFLGKAKALDRLAEQQRSNALLADAIEAYKRYLAMENDIESVSDDDYRAAGERCIDRMRFMGLYAPAVAIHNQLITRFHNEPELRNQLAVTYLMMNRFADAKLVLQETLSRSPGNGFAQVHYGFVLKQHDGDYEQAVEYLRNGIASQAEGTQHGRFFFNLGDALQRLGRKEEAFKVYEQGAALKLFPSAYQRSLYNVPNLRAQPFWSKHELGAYKHFLDKLEHNWKVIRDEAVSVLGRSGYFVDETENLRDSGDWKQFELFARGQRNTQNCQKVPITCSLIETFRAASGCRRGQVKFSVMHPGTHVWPHCGPTNCRLRAHLGLVVPPGAVLRVAREERTWTEGEFLIFDDSFEHEVWHNGSNVRVVLIVDMWHPDLTDHQRRMLSPI